MTAVESVGAGVYSVPGEVQPTDPFESVRPADPDQGWNAARNLLKSLNHLDLMRNKDEVARRLGAMIGEVPGAAGGPLLHHARAGTNELSAIRETADSLGSGKATANDEFESMLSRYATVAHMEFHPTDRCNLACKGCTYGHDVVDAKPDPVSFPWSQLHRIQDLEPVSIVIVGGGEPTLYKSQGHGFAEMVLELRRILPTTKFALITNGTYVPDGSWTDELSWVRLSIDAAHHRTYELVRGRPMLERVMRGLTRYLDSNIPQVGVSFLYSKFNINEAVPFARKTFEFVRSRGDDSLPRVNVQYRPLRVDGDIAAAHFDFAVTRSEILQVAAECEEAVSSDPEFGSFLREQTNIRAVAGGNVHPAHDFDRCRYSQIFTILRANGDLRPCFNRVREPAFLIGNLISSPLEMIGLKKMRLALIEDTGCNPQNCRQCHVNNVLSRGIKNQLQPSASPSVLLDPMF